jgi:hypothetical protein
MCSFVGSIRFGSIDLYSKKGTDRSLLLVILQNWQPQVAPEEDMKSAIFEGGIAPVLLWLGTDIARCDILFTGGGGAPCDTPG